MAEVTVGASALDTFYRDLLDELGELRALVDARDVLDERVRTVASSDGQCSRSLHAHRTVRTDGDALH